MGGEKWGGIGSYAGLVGSPPHRRGKEGLAQQIVSFLGITPAQAGKSKLALCTPSCPTDHPRVGGEKSRCGTFALQIPGSPPHGRGKVRALGGQFAQPGITPAQAGKSSQRTGAATSCQDHPRIGGEKADTDTQTYHQLGSPPRGRGKAVRDGRQPGRMGITPAWAGKSDSHHPRPESQQDHPRMGGEKFVPLAASSRSLGSPPHGRGKAGEDHLVTQLPGITPAWAGKSPRS